LAPKSLSVRVDRLRRQHAAARDHLRQIESNDVSCDGGEVRKIAAETAAEIEHAIER
jgi:hypothetical protein